MRAFHLLDPRGEGKISLKVWQHFLLRPRVYLPSLKPYLTLALALTLTLTLTLTPIPTPILTVAVARFGSTS